MVFNVKRLIRFYKKHVLDVQHPDHIVRMILINRKAGIHLLSKNPHHFFQSGVCRNAGHIDPRNHDVLRQCISEVKHIVDHVFFFALNHAVFVGHVHVGSQLFFRNGLMPCVPDPEHF